MKFAKCSKYMFFCATGEIYLPGRHSALKLLVNIGIYKDFHIRLFLGVFVLFLKTVSMIIIKENNANVLNKKNKTNEKICLAAIQTRDDSLNNSCEN